jgi:hypothetical protein
VFARQWREEQGKAVKGGAFVPLKFQIGEAFQCNWSTEYAFVGGRPKRLEVARSRRSESCSIAGE